MALFGRNTWKTEESALRKQLAGCCLGVGEPHLAAPRPAPCYLLNRLLDASSVLPHRFGRLCPVVHPKHLVDGAQVLLDRRLRQVQPPRYLGVAQALHYHLQDLSLTGREVPNFGALLLA